MQNQTVFLGETREKIGDVIKSDGTKWIVYLPKTDVLLQFPLHDPHFIVKLSATAINLPLEDFLKWDLPDSIKVIVMVSQSVSLFMNQNGTL